MNKSRKKTGEKENVRRMRKKGERDEKAKEKERIYR